MVADSQPAASRSGRKLHGTNVFRDMLQQPSSKTICHLPTTSGAPLCRDDRPDRIIFPDKVFGRQPHLDALSEAYAKYACAGHPTLLLVYGGAGTGKTALVKEARRTVFPGNPFFLHGKFDQYERYTPYNGILRAAKALLEQILTGSDKKNISSRILAAVGLHGKLLTDVLPELELLIGAQPPVSELPPVENEIRFQQVFKKFVTVFAQPTSPLVIFFDDLQWVDQASLNLIQKLLANDRPHHFMIIGAYRDNEVTPPHPLLQTIAELKDAQLPVQTLAVEPLSETYLNKWCMEIFATGQDQTLPLTRTLLKKTDGNPFFARQFLLFCHRADLLSFNAKGGGWQWTIDTIDQCNVNDSVTDLMARRLGSLGPAAREVLSIAACIGYQFDSTTLFTVSGIERKQIITALCEALLEKLITLDEPDSDQENLKTGGFRCRFLHDRIYQAAYALLSNEKRSRLHLKIGTMLLHRQDTENTGEIFEIANHLNEGAALITDDELRLRTANLNLMAGEKAKSAAAYAAAAQYLAAGLKILPTSSKQEIYKLGWNLKLAQAECEYLNGDFTKAEESFLALLQNTQSPLDRARIYRTKVVLYEHLGTPHQSYECGVAGMNLLDFPMPLHPSWCLLLKELLPLLYKLRGKGLALLQNLKPMTDEKMILAMDIAHKTIAAAYFLDVRLVVLLSAKMTTLSLKHGHTKSTPAALATLGVFWGSFLGKLKDGATIGEIALSLSKTPAYEAIRCKTNFIVGNYIAGWSADNQHALQLMQQGVKDGLASGETTYLTYCAVNEVMVRYISGAPLSEAQDNYRKYEEIYAASNYNEMTSIVHALKRNIDKLQSPRWNGKDASTATYDEDAYLAEIEPQDIKTTLYLFYFHKMVGYIVFNQFKLAYETGKKIDFNIEDVLFGSPQSGYFFLYHGLSITQLLETFPPLQRIRHLVTLQRYRRKMRKWAESCPVNFRHQYLLLEAETARVRGNASAAVLFDQAIEAARENGFLQHTAFANEMAAMLHLRGNNEQVARDYLAAATNAYREWGAVAKVNKLKDKFPTLR